MPYCMQCGTAAAYTIPKADTRQRLVCSACGFVYYDNPKLICGALVCHQDQILLCRRAIEPRYGYWTLPAGFMEIGETMQQAALRETLEEAAAIATQARLYCVFDIAYLGQVHMMYLSHLNADGKFGVGEESLECRLFAFDQIPWADLAFDTIKQTLERYLADRQQLVCQGKNPHDFSHYPMHQIVLDPLADDKWV